MLFQKYKAFKTIDLPDRSWLVRYFQGSIVVLSGLKRRKSSPD